MLVRSCCFAYSTCFFFFLVAVASLYLKAPEKRETKTCNVFCNIAAKRVEKRCGAFYHHLSNLLTTLCCKTGLMWVVKHAIALFNSFFFILPFWIRLVIWEQLSLSHGFGQLSESRNSFQKTRIGQPLLIMFWKEMKWDVRLYHCSSSATGPFEHW